MAKPMLLFVEEVKSSLSQKVISRIDVNVVLLRFKSSMNFDSDYMALTSGRLSFIYEKEFTVEEEVERFKVFCKVNNIVIDFFYNDSEYNQELIQEFARRLDLKGSLDSHQSLCVRDKGVMKDKINEIGLKCMKYQEDRDIESVLDFTEKISNFPIIVKWRRGLSSKEVYMLNNKHELEKLGLDFSKGRYIVEEFNPNKIWCIDGLIQNGKVIGIFYSWLPYTNLSFVETKDKFVQITVDQKPEWFKFDGQIIIQKIVSELKLKNGYMHLEAFIDDLGDPTICEFAWRTPGEHMLLNHSRAYGLDVYDILIDIMIGRKVDPISEAGNRCVGDMFLPINSGKIDFITPFSDINLFEGVLDGGLFYKLGDVVENKRQYTSCSGWVQVEGKDEHEVLRRMLNIYNIFEIRFL